MASANDAAMDGQAPYEAELRVRCADPADADALRRALQVEADDPLPRADVRIEPDEGDEAGQRFLVTIRAQEPAYFRAALNSYLKWLQVADAGLDAGRS